MSEQLRFSTNWNNKLNCKAFTTVRLYNPAKYFAGARFRAILADRNGKVVTDHGDVVVVDTRVIKLDQINEFVARLDTGYSAEEMKNIIRTMYGKTITDWNKQHLQLILLIKSENAKGE